MEDYYDNRSPVSPNHDLEWASPLVWIVRRIQDENYNERFIPQLKEKINEYINQPGQSINDKVKDLNNRTMLSWTVESEKLDIFMYLLEHGATDNWQDLLKRSNKYYKKAKKTYKKEKEKDEKRFNILWARIHVIEEDDIMDVDDVAIDEDDDAVIEEDYTVAAVADAAINEDDDTIDEDDDTMDEDDDTMDVLPNGQPPTMIDLLNEADTILQDRRKKDLLLKKQKELNDFIIEYVKKLEVRMLTVTAPHMKKTLPTDIIGKLTEYFTNDKGTRNKAMKNYTKNIANKSTRKRKTENTASNSIKKSKVDGGKKKSKKNLKKKATRKSRK